MKSRVVPNKELTSKTLLAEDYVDPEAGADKRPVKRHFTVEAGRSICRNGVHMFTLDSAEWVAPTEADELCHIIAALLNRLGRREVKTTYLGESKSRLR